MSTVCASTQNERPARQKCAKCSAQSAVACPNNALLSERNAESVGTASHSTHTTKCFNSTARAVAVHSNTWTIHGNSSEDTIRCGCAQRNLNELRSAQVRFDWRFDDLHFGTPPRYHISQHVYYACATHTHTLVCACLRERCSKAMYRQHLLLCVDMFRTPYSSIIPALPNPLVLQSLWMYTLQLACVDLFRSCFFYLILQITICLYYVC